MFKFKSQTLSTWKKKISIVQNKEPESALFKVKEKSEVKFDSEELSESLEDTEVEPFDVGSIPVSESKGDVEEYIKADWENDMDVRNKKSALMDSECDINDLEIEMDQNGDALEDFYGEARAGDYFGELALLKGDPKSMSAWCR